MLAITSSPSVPVEQLTHVLDDQILDVSEASQTLTIRVGIDTTGATVGDQVELLLGAAGFTPAKSFTLSSDQVADGFVDFSVSSSEFGADGAKSLTARVTDAGGTPSAQSAALVFTKDTTAPVAPGSPTEQGTTKLQDGYLNASEATTSTTIRVSLATSGAVQGDTVELLLNGGSFTTPKKITLSSVNIVDAYVDFTFPASDLGVDGAKTLTARVTDAAGNPSLQSVGFKFTQDTTAPLAPSAPVEQGSTKLTDGLLNASEAGTSTTIRVGLRTSGAVAGDVVQLLLGGVVIKTSVSLTSTDITTNGYVDFTVTSADLGSDGVKSLTARLTDQAGNVGAAGSALGFTKDSAGPSAIASAPVEVFTTKLADYVLDAIESASSLTIRVSLAGTTAATGDKVELLWNSLLIVASTNVTASNIADGWVDILVLSSKLGSNGSTQLTARLTDAAGNPSSQSPALSFTKDASPSAPFEHGSTKLNDRYLSNNESGSPLQICVWLGASAASVGDTVELLLNGLSFTSAKTQTLSSSDIINKYVSFNVYASDLVSDGQKSLTAKITVTSGTPPTAVSTVTPALTFTKDTTPPTATSKPAEQGTTKLQDAYLNATEATTSTTIRVGLGTSGAVQGDTLELLLNGSPFTSAKIVILAGVDIGNAYVDFLVTAADLAADSLKSLTARVTDQAGNTSGESLQLQFTQDTAVPGTPTSAPSEQFTNNLADHVLNVIEATAPTTIRVSLAGTNAAAGDTVELLLNSASFGTAKKAVLLASNITDGFVDFSAASGDLGADGSKSLTARVTDAAGNPSGQSVALLFIKDTTAPAAPNAPIEQGSTKLADGLLNASEANTTTTIRVRLGSSGALAGDTVELLLGGLSFASPKTVTLSGGNITAGYVDFSVTSADLGADGTESLNARVIDAAGNPSPSSSALVFTKDATAPLAPNSPIEQGTTKLADGCLNAAESGTSTTIRGSLGSSGAVVGDTVQLLLGGVLIKPSAPLTSTDVTNSYVDFAVTSADLGSDGVKSLTAQVTDQAGNVGAASAALGFTKDTVSPLAPSAPVEQGSTKLTDGILNSVEAVTPTTFRVTLGTSGAVAGDTVELLVDGAVIKRSQSLTSVDITTNKYVDFVVSTADLGSDGFRSLTARVRDQAGNAGAESAIRTFLKDVIAPLAPVSRPVEQFTNNLADSVINVVEAATPMTIRVSLGSTNAVAGDTVELLLNSGSFGTPKRTTLTSSHLADGWVDFTVYSGDLGADGSKSLTARVTDAGGNPSPQSPALVFTKDTTAPLAPNAPVELVTTKLVDGYLNISEAATTTNVRVWLGTSGAVMGDTVELLLGGMPFAAAKTVTLTFTDVVTHGYVDYAIATSDLGADGVKSLTARVTDVVGNPSPQSNALAFTKDTAAPTAPIVPMEQGTAKLGDGFLNIVEVGTSTTIRVSLAGTNALAGDTVQLLLGGVVIKTSAQLTSTDITNTYVDLTVATKDWGGDGVKSLTAQVTDRAGNVGAAGPALTFMKDTAAPTAPNAPMERGTAKLGDGYLNIIEAGTATTIRVVLGSSGAAVADTVQLLLGGAAIKTSAALTLTDITNGYVEFSVTAADLGADGVKSLTSQVIDQAGNVGAAGAALGFTKDTLAPTAPSVPAEQATTKLADGYLNIVEAGTLTTIRVDLGASGAMPGDTVELLLGAASFVPAKTAVLAAGDVSNNYVDFTVASADLGPEGVKSLTVKVVDQAGNVGAVSDAFAFVVDLTAPRLLSFAVDQQPGTYGIGTVITITATASEPVQSLQVTLNTGAVLYLATSGGGSQLVGAYTVMPGDTTLGGDLSVTGTNGTDLAGNPIAPLAGGGTAGSNIYVYWATNGEVYRSQTATNSPATRILTAPSPGWHIDQFDIDNRNAAIYFSASDYPSANNSRIYRANLDGTGVQLISSGSLGHINYSLTVDEASGNVYLHSHDRSPLALIGPSYDGGIQRISPTGSVTSFSANYLYVHDMEVDEQNSRLYFSSDVGNVSGTAGLFSSNLDGSNVVTLASAAKELALDTARNVLYFTNGNSVYRRDLVTGTVTALPISAAYFTDIDYSAADDKLYWWATTGSTAAQNGAGVGNIFRSNVDGSGVELLTAADPGAISYSGGDIAIAPMQTNVNLPAGRVIDGALKLTVPPGFSDGTTPIVNLGNVTVIPIQFNTPMTGVSLAAFTLILNGRVPVSLRGASLTGSGASYTLTLPRLATNTKGTYTLSINPGRGVAAQANGFLLPTPLSLQWGNGVVAAASTTLAVAPTVSTAAAVTKAAPMKTTAVSPTRATTAVPQPVVTAPKPVAKPAAVKAPAPTTRPVRK